MSLLLSHWYFGSGVVLDCIDSLSLHPTYFQQCGILTRVDSDQPVQPPLKLKNSKQCSVSGLTVIEYSSD